MKNSPNIEKKQFVALVLAADRTGNDPITTHTGAACKAFAPVAGTPMVLRVLDTLTACDLVAKVILCGPPESLHTHCPELKQRIASGQISWLSNKNTASRSAESGLELIQADTPVLLTTADHALLTPMIVQSFLKQSLEIDNEATVGLARQEDIARAFPGSKRTVHKLQDGGFCGCNLYTFNPNGRKLVGFWRQAEDFRKRPWQLISKVIGFRLLMSYLFKQLTLTKALHAVSQKSGVNIQAVILNDPRAGVDVDKVKDLQLAESILARAPISVLDKNRIN